MKKPTIKALKGKLWVVFSEYIRRKEKGICFSCGIVKNWKEMHAGHFEHQGKYSELAYDKDSIIHCQCPKCNTFKHGNLGEYTLKMIDRYGIKKVKEFKKQAMIVKKWKINELQKLIEYYKNKLNAL